MNPKFYFVYVLFSLKDHQFYIGYTGRSPEVRFLEHMEGKNISTAKRRPLILIYYEAHLSEEDAKRREDYFKTTKGKVTLKQVLRKNLGTITRINYTQITKSQSQRLPFGTGSLSQREAVGFGIISNKIILNPTVSPEPERQRLVQGHWRGSV